MTSPIPNRPFLTLLLVCLFVLAGQTNAQRIAFSIDVQGPTAGSFGTVPGRPDSFYGQEIGGADILTVGLPPQTPLPEPNLAARGQVDQPPGILVFGTNQGIPNSRSLNLNPVPIGSMPTLEAEIDALSFGRDEGRVIFFSVDEFSLGTDGGVAEQALRAEASADIFRNMIGLPENTLIVDGHGGEQPNRALGLGLIEPNPPDDEIDHGDNLDALAMNATTDDVAGLVYFSLDAAFDDPLESANPPNGPNIGSAQRNNFSGADVLVAAPDEPPQVFISAQELGLDPNSDDVDALALLDVNRDGMFDPVQDTVVFSVRRGSQIIDQNDSALGQPIGPSDILRPPVEPNQPPQIFLPANLLGLSNGLGQNLIAPVGHLAQDDLDAFSVGLHGDGDMNCNFRWDRGDVPAFAVALESSALYESTYELCIDPTVRHGDLNQDGSFGFQDIEDFVLVMEMAGTLNAAEALAILASATVPEPANQHLAAAILALLCFGSLRSGRRS